MKKLQWHRVLAFVMTLCMLLSMCPVSAFAAETAWTDHTATVKVGDSVTLTLNGSITSDDVTLGEDPGVTVSCGEPTSEKALSEFITEADGFDGTGKYIITTMRSDTDGMLTSGSLSYTLSWSGLVVTGLKTNATVSADTEEVWVITSHTDDDENVTYTIGHDEKYLSISSTSSASNAALVEDETALQMEYVADDGYWYIKNADGSSWLSQVGGFDNQCFGAAGYPQKDGSGWKIRQVVDQTTTTITITGTKIGTTTLTIGGTAYTVNVTDGTVASGTCGATGNEENVTWKLDDQGTLTISGTGAMADYKRGGSNPTPWTSAPWGEHYYDKVKSIVVEEGVTSIGNYAFSFLVWTESVTLPSTLTTIGNYAFNRISYLTDVVIPDNVTEIGNYAFNECTKLASVTLPKKLEIIGSRAFYGCTKLTSIVIPEGTKEIYSQAFYQCTALTSVTLPSTLESINAKAFYGCSALESVNIPASVTSIGDQAFYACKKMATLTLNEGLQTIGERAFQDCDALTSLVIPSSVTSIGSEAFADLDVMAEIEIKEGLTTISSEAFSYLYKLTTLRLPKSLTSIESKAFYLNIVSNSKLTDVYYNGTAEDYAKISIATGNDVVNYTAGQKKPAFHFQKATVEPTVESTIAVGTTETKTFSGAFSAENVTVSNAGIVELSFATTDMTEITSADDLAGKNLILVSERSTTEGLLTGDTYTATLSWYPNTVITGLNTHGTVSADTTHLWTITPVTEGTGYYVKYGEKYLTVSYDASTNASNASLVDDATALKIAYTDGYWYITNADGIYLSTPGGFEHGYYGAAGFHEQGGSGWKIYAPETITTVTATGAVEGETLVTLGENIWKITVSGHVHTYGTPAITWNEDNTATATVTCSSCEADADGHTLTLTATVGEPTVTPGTCTTKEKTVYTATVTFNGQDYTDTKTVEGEYGDHSYDANGFCTANSSHYQPAVLNDGVYEIANAGQLYWFAAQVNGGEVSISAKLTGDITVNPGTFAEDGTYTAANGETCRAWTPIGASGTGKQYIGTFDGGEHTITGLYVNKNGTSSAYNYAGLFGYITTGAAIRNVTVSGSWIHGYSYVGAITGSAGGGTIENCHNVATFVGAANSNVGGIAGSMLGTISKCSNTGTVTNTGTAAGGNAGGIAGKGTIISDCTNGGTVTSDSSQVGGIAGTTGSDGAITGCTNNAVITGKQETGGIVGDSTCAITSCTNTALIDGIGSKIGGIAGTTSANITGCTNIGNVGVQSRYSSTLGGIVGYVDTKNVVISKCCNGGTVSGTGNLGGIAGQIKNVTITDCYNIGDLVADSAPGSGSSYLGGIVGDCYAGTVTNSYNIGTITPDDTSTTSTYIGGLVGRNNTGTVTNCFYLTGCATDGKGTTQYGIGGTKAGNTTKDTDGRTNGKTAQQFASGEIAYLLNGSTSEGSPIWFQNIDNDETLDTCPKFVGGTVYYHEADSTYSNTDSALHHYTNGFCTDADCDQPYEPAKLNDDGVYEIANGGQLYWFAQLVNASTGHNEKAVLTQDIFVNTNVLVDGELNGDAADTFRTWTPINTSNGIPYAGTFDGQGHSISGLYYTSTSGKYVGLIGCLSGTVENVTLKDSYFCGYQEIGGIVGRAKGTSTAYAIVRNCENYAVVKSEEKTGGIVGYSQYLTVENCANYGAITTTKTMNSSYTGGIVGYAQYLTMVKCQNNGTVTGQQYTGGLAGQVKYADIDDCFNAASVNGVAYVGGISGHIDSHTTVDDCYNTGSALGAGKYVGGIVGYTESSNYLTNCFYLENSANDGKVNQAGIGWSKQGTSQQDSEGNTDVKTASQFASGEVAFLLNHSTAVATDKAPLVWFQNVDNDQTHDASPKFVGAIVYGDEASEKYSNTPVVTHTYVNGFCAHESCDYPYQPAKKNTNGVYQITNAGNLYWFAAKVNGGETDLNAILAQDIVVNEQVLSEGALVSDTSSLRSWTPIGYYNSSKDNVSYTGTFYGQGYSISGLFFQNKNAEYVGLFGRTQNATVKYLEVANSYFGGKAYVAAVVAYANNSSILGCRSSSYVEDISRDKVNSYTGGVVGNATNLTSVEDCYNTGTVVSVDPHVGGVVGDLSGSMTDCYNTGVVRSTSTMVGGVVGYATYYTENHTGTVTGCYNTGSVTGSSDVGGVAGYINHTIVSKCYNTGSVTLNSTAVLEYGVGGVVGTSYLQTTITDCYNTGNVTSNAKAVGGVVGSNKSAVSNCYNTGKITGTTSDLTNSGTLVGAISGKNWTDATVTNCYYLTGSAVDGNGTTQNGVGNVTLGSVTEDTDATTAVTTEELASGKITVALAAQRDSFPWRQTLETDPIPNFTGKTVYSGYKGCQIGYSNKAKDLSETPGDHTYENGVCTGCGAKDPSYNVPVNVGLQVGHTATYTDTTGNYTGADLSGLDTTVATATITGTAGTYALGDTVTELTSGNTYILVNTRANKALTNGSATWSSYGGLGFGDQNAAESIVLWTIEAVEGGYTIRNLDGKYLTGGQNAASVGDTADVLTIEYADSNWRISKDGYYLNDAGGQHTCAFFWQESGYEPATDVGSQWAIYAVTETAPGSSQITFTGVKAGTTSVTIGKTQYNITVADCTDHNYVEVVADEYLKSAANCQSAAVYYKSCSYCGAASETDTFTHGDVDSTNHTGTLGDWQHDADKHWKEYSCCGAHAEETAHDDENHNHACDTCGATVSNCADTNNDHHCDVCNKEMTQCVDENKDHKCDICGETMGEHAAADGKHTCDYCGEKVTDCVDTDKNHKCDICGETMGEHKAADGSHICDYCGKAASDCVDSNKDHKCDVCGETMGEHKAAEGSHDCAYCGNPVTECADNDKDHYCDVCGNELTKCADNDKDHNCDVCGKELSDCVDDDHDGKCDICGTVLSYVTRLSGKNRYITAIKVADELKEVLGVEKFDTIIVAAGENFADALSGSYLSTMKNAPILLCYNGNGNYPELDAQNIAYIKENLAENGTVYILGGTAAVNDSYESELANYKVERLRGKNRFGTNQAILEEAGIPAGSEILVCTAYKYADSLSASSTGKPILLVHNQDGKLYGVDEEFLSTLEDCTFTIIGGTGAVGSEFEEILEQYGTVNRLSGKTRYQTSVLVAETYFNEPSTAVMAYAWNYPDGLCGGTLAHAKNAPLILTQSGSEDAAVAYTTANGIHSGYVLGGAKFISDDSARTILGLSADFEVVAK